MIGMLRRSPSKNLALQLEDIFNVKLKMLKILEVSHQVIFYLETKEPTNLQSFKALCH